MRDTEVDVVGVLSRVGGLSKDEIRKLWQETKDNHQRLSSCEGPHDLQPHERHGKMVRTYRCTRCGGVIHSSNARCTYSASSTDLLAKEVARSGPVMREGATPQPRMESRVYPSAVALL